MLYLLFIDYLQNALEKCRYSTKDLRLRFIRFEMYEQYDNSFSALEKQKTVERTYVRHKITQVWLGSIDGGSWTHVGHDINTSSSCQLAAWQTNVIMYVLYYQVWYVLYPFIDYLHEGTKDLLLRLTQKQNVKHTDVRHKIAPACFPRIHRRRVVSPRGTWYRHK